MKALTVLVQVCIVSIIFILGMILGVQLVKNNPKNELDVIHENHIYNIQLPEEFMFATESDSLRAYTRNDTLFVWYN